MRWGGGRRKELNSCFLQKSTGNEETGNIRGRNTVILFRCMEINFKITFLKEVQVVTFGVRGMGGRG